MEVVSQSDLSGDREGVGGLQTQHTATSESSVDHME